MSCSSSQAEDGWVPDTMDGAVVLNISRKGSSSDYSLPHLLATRELYGRVIGFSQLRRVANIDRLRHLFKVDSAHFPRRLCVKSPSSEEMACFSPDSQWIVRSNKRNNQKGWPAKRLLLHFFRLLPKSLVFEHSMILNELSAESDVSLTFGPSRSSIAASVVVQHLSESAIPPNHSRVVSLRVDILVPWAMAQFSVESHATFCTRQDKNGRPIDRRVLHLHSHGAVVNCGHQLLLVTVGRSPLLPVNSDERRRKTWLLLTNRPPEQESGLFSRVSVEVGELISVRRALPFYSASIERASPHRFGLGEVTEERFKAYAWRKFTPQSVMRLIQFDTMKPAFISHQTIALETYIQSLLSRHFERMKDCEYFGLIDYEPVVTGVIEKERDVYAKVQAFVVAEIRRVHPESGVSTNYFVLVDLELWWEILRGDGVCRVNRLVRLLNHSEVVDRRRWFDPPPIEEAPGDVIFSLNANTDKKFYTAALVPQLVLFNPWAGDCESLDDSLSSD